MGVVIRACVYVVLGLIALVVVVPAAIADLEPGPLFFPGILIAIVGLAIYIWTIWVFVTVGRGTPVPLDPPRALVVSGLYRWVRNPMAIGFTVILIGEAVAFSSRQLLTYAVVVFFLVYLFVVFVEEPDLKRRFGAPYTEYCQSVPRWLPRLSAFRHSN